MLVCVVGNFGENDNLTDGQGIKTLELYRALVRRYGTDEVCRVNLYKKNKVVLALKLLVNLIRCQNMIVLVSVNGRKTVIPLLAAFNKVFRRRIFHSLIGSTTHKTLEENPNLRGCYNSLAGNWSETSTEKKLLEDLGLTNVTVVKNFKHLQILAPEQLCYTEEAPFRLCTFSRVEAKKGIPNIVRAVNEVNRRRGKTVYTLDIYGKVEDHYLEEFEELKKEFGEAVRYMGVVDFDKSVETIRPYYMLVFPTRYYTEGIPGTILDAMAAGVPILSAHWESCYDVMTPEIGLIYDFDDDEALFSALEYALENVETVNGKKLNCLAEADRYNPDTVVKTIGAYLKGNTQ